MKIWIVGPIALDSVLFLDSSFTDSGYIHVRKKTERPGGQGLNVATGLKSASLDVQLVGYLGNDSNAQKLLQVILALGLTSDYLARVDAPSPHIMVLVDSSGERKMVGLERSFYETVRLPLENIKSGDIVIWTWWRKEFTEDFKVCKSIRATTVVGLEALQDSNIEADLFIGSEEIGRAHV